MTRDIGRLQSIVEAALDQELQRLSALTRDEAQLAEQLNQHRSHIEAQRKLARSGSLADQSGYLRYKALADHKLAELNQQLAQLRVRKEVQMQEARTALGRSNAIDKVARQQDEDAKRMRLTRFMDEISSGPHS